MASSAPLASADAPAPFVLCPSGSGVKISPSDTNYYRPLVLPNKLRCVLVSDPDADKAAVCMTVRVGHLQDPLEVGGLAHFLEHMLFLGTDKYPDETEYKRYLKAHGGSSNASTGPEKTSYHFEVLQNALPGALDRFARFFVAPQLTEAATGREMNAVDSEFRRNLTEDGRRLYQLGKHLARPGHPYNRFGTGSLETLKTIPEAQGTPTRTLLWDFYRRFYSANQMCLGVVARDHLDTLEAWVRAQFADVPNHDAPRTSLVEAGLPYTARELARQVHVVPLREARSLRLQWPVPARPADDPSPPDAYVSFLLGHEGPGSLLSALKRRGWATQCSAGGQRFYQGAESFLVHLELTPEGEAHVNEVVRLVFQTIARVRSSDEPLAWVWDELARRAAMRFRFEDKPAPLTLAQGLASVQFDYRPEDVRTGFRLLGSLDRVGVEALLACLSPQNLLLTRISKSMAPICDRVERWYGTRWGQAALSAVQLEAWGVEADEATRLSAATARVISDRTEAELAADAARARSGPNASASEGADGGGASAASTSAMGERGVAEPASEEDAGEVSGQWSPVTTHRWSLPLLDEITLPKPNPYLPDEFSLRFPGPEGTSRRKPMVAATSAIVVPAAATDGATADEAKEGDSPSLHSALEPTNPREGLPPAVLMAEAEDETRRWTTTPASGASVAGTRRTQLWYRGDTRFQLPRTRLVLDVLCDPSLFPEGDMRARARHSLLFRVLRDVLTEPFYDAATAGYSFSIAASVRTGFSLEVSGFSQKLPRLATDLARALAHIFSSSSSTPSPSPSPASVDSTPVAVSRAAIEEAFVRQRELAEREIASRLKEGSSFWADCASSEFLFGTDMNVWDSLAALRELTVDDLVAQAQRLRSRARLQCFVQGNVTAAEAAELAASLEHALFEGEDTAEPTSSSPSIVPWDEVRELTCVDLPAGTEFQVTRRHANTEDVNSAVLTRFVLGPVTPRGTALAMLLDQTLSQPFFSTLRTQEQLGYSVHARYVVESGALLLQCMVQSPSHTTAHVHRRIRAFLRSFRAAVLEPLTEEQVAAYTGVLRRRIEQSDKKQADEFGRLATEIGRGSFRFDKEVRIGEALATLTKADLLRFFDEHVAFGGRERRCLTVRLVSNNPVAPDNRRPETSPSPSTPLAARGGAGTAMSASGAAVVDTDVDRVDADAVVVIAVDGATGIVNRRSVPRTTARALVTSAERSFAPGRGAVAASAGEGVGGAAVVVAEDEVIAAEEEADPGFRDVSALSGAEFRDAIGATLPSFRALGRARLRAGEVPLARL